MPVAVSQTAGQQGAGVTSLTTSSVTPGGNDRYVLAVSASRGDGPATALYNGSGGTALTPDTLRTISFTRGRGRTFRILGGPTADTTGHATYTGDPGDIASTAVSFLFLNTVDQTTPADAVSTVEDVNGDSVTTVTPTITRTGLSPGEFVAVALQLSQISATNALSSITAANAATTVREPRFGALTGGNSVATAWLTGNADGSGNITLAVNVTKDSGAVLGWWLEAYSINEAAGGGPTQYEQAVAGSMTPAGALSKQVSRSLAGSTTPAGAAARSTLRLLSGSVLPSGALSQSIVLQRLVAGSITAAGALAASARYVRSWAASITPSGALAKLTARALAGAVTAAGGLSRRIARVVSGAVSLAGAAAGAAARTTAIGGSITFAGSLSAEIVETPGVSAVAFRENVNDQIAVDLGSVGIMSDGSLRMLL